MASPRPITGIFAPLKKKIVNKNIKASGGNVKVVSGNHGPNKNVDEMLRKGFNKDADTTALRRKSGELAKTRASQVDVGKPKKVVQINSNLGGLTGTKKLGGGGGFFGLPKNR